jgi:predicted dehydrogenase
MVGARDRNDCQFDRFGAHHGLQGFMSLEALLASDEIDTVVNLTNPGIHFEISLVPAGG